MALALDRLDPAGADRDDLVAFLTSGVFPFHMRPRPTREQVLADIDDGAYRDDDNDTFWLVDDELGRVGFIRFEDLSEMVPLFDLRIAEAARGRGLGTQALRLATEHVFTTLDVTRFEGQTREDNIAMRKVFLRCGWIKEAHYREAWPVEGGAPLASVGYGILRRDWETGTTTPFAWEDVAI